MICQDCHGNGFIVDEGSPNCPTCNASGHVTVREALLLEARDLVSGDRAETHGAVDKNFENIGALWSGYLKKEISLMDVGNMLALLKIARTQTNPQHRDNYVDGAGYMALNGEVNLEEEGE